MSELYQTACCLKSKYSPIKYLPVLQLRQNSFWANIHDKIWLTFDFQSHTCSHNIVHASIMYAKSASCAKLRRLQGYPYDITTLLTVNSILEIGNSQINYTHCSYLNIYISRKIRLRCVLVDLECQFQTSLQDKL